VASKRDCRPPFTAVLDVLSRQDPEELLAIGAPADEYEPEANDFAQRLRDGQQITGDVVVEVWERWLGPDSEYVRGAAAGDVDALATILDALRCAGIVRGRSFGRDRLSADAPGSARLASCLFGSSHSCPR
jgi:hypothetical protein